MYKRQVEQNAGAAEHVICFTVLLGDPETVLFGHRIGAVPVSYTHLGELINKYGEEIGIAPKDIKKGEYVHVHNLDSRRGRGDWAKEGKEGG